MRPIKAFKFCIIVVVVLIAGYYIHGGLIVQKEIPVEGEYQKIKGFTFSSTSEIESFEEKLFSRKSTDYGISDHEGRKCLEAISKESASAIVYKQRISRDKDVLISWEWKVEEFPSGGEMESLKKKEDFDFAAQVYVIFYSKFFLNTKAIQYVWAEKIPAGTIGSSPYTSKVKVLVLESGMSEAWKMEKRNIREDFLKLFGYAQEKDIAAIAFMTDSDSTRSSSRAYYSNLIIEGLDALPVKRKTKKNGKGRGAEVEVKKRDNPVKKDFEL